MVKLFWDFCVKIYRKAKIGSFQQPMEFFGNNWKKVRIFTF